MPSPPRDFYHFRGRGFTIIELMVAISIIAILIALIIPSMGALTQNTRSSAAINSISVAATVARYHATRKINPVDLDGVNESPYRGAAAIITNANEVRIVEHDQDAKYGGGANDYLELQNNGMPGFQDVKSVEYIRLPSSGAVFGVIRTGTGSGNLKLIAPPFAIRFDQYGRLVTAKTRGTGGVINYNLFAYYDGNANGTYQTTNWRGSGYEPPASPVWDSTAKKYELPFEELETVADVIVLESKDGLDYTSGGDGTLSNNAQVQSILDNGKMLLFSRYTGAPLRND